MNNIISMCSEQNVPFVFALGRRALGRACAKLVPVSVVGIFNYEGSEVGQPPNLLSVLVKIMDLLNLTHIGQHHSCEILIKSFKQSQ